MKRFARVLLIIMILAGSSSIVTLLAIEEEEKRTAPTQSSNQSSAAPKVPSKWAIDPDDDEEEEEEEKKHFWARMAEKAGELRLAAEIGWRVKGRPAMRKAEDWVKEHKTELYGAGGTIGTIALLLAAKKYKERQKAKQSQQK
ncbi:MAG: hypothetical protein QG604_216 [Candidatus Dependentiae bacterium]|nr:hypothetical protein [Candidatus Dependentiae bacterium]